MTSLPSLSDFGTYDESAYPELWRGCVGAWAPCLGPTGLRLIDFSRRNIWANLINMDAQSDWLLSSGQYAVDFDGSDDYGLIGQAMPSFDRTISAWFFRSTTTGRRGIFGTRPTGGTAGYFLSTSVTSAGTLSYQHPGITAVTSAGGIWSAGVWNHVAATLTGLAVNIFLNGRSVHTGTVAALETASTVAWIGAEEGPGLEVFQGQLDDIRVYDRALSVSEIRLLASGRGIAYQRRLRRSYFAEQIGPTFRAAWARNSNYIISPVGAA